jgi:hypothetical protein
MGSSDWEGYAVYAGSVRLGTVERAWRDRDTRTVIMVRNLFPGVAPLVVRLDHAAHVREGDRRIEVGRELVVLPHARSNGVPSRRVQA